MNMLPPFSLLLHLQREDGRNNFSETLVPGYYATISYIPEDFNPVFYCRERTRTDGLTVSLLLAIVYCIIL